MRLPAVLAPLGGTGPAAPLPRVRYDGMGRARAQGQAAGGGECAEQAAGETATEGEHESERGMIMRHDYTPRRSGKRWREGAPDYILDCFDNRNPGERYTVLLGGDWLIRDKDAVYVQGIGMSDAPTHPQGVSLWFELKAHEQAAYRYRNHHRRVRWLDLPEHIREHVITRVAA